MTTLAVIGGNTFFDEGFDSGDGNAPSAPQLERLNFAGSQEPVCRGPADVQHVHEVFDRSCLDPVHKNPILLIDTHLHMAVFSPLNRNLILARDISAALVGTRKIIPPPERRRHHYRNY